jgi:hypothetical protein
MTIKNLLETSTDETGGGFTFSLSRQQRVFQTTITGTQTVTLQGRIDTNHSYVDIVAFTATGATLISMLPQIRVVTSGTSTGSSISTLAW